MEQQPVLYVIAGPNGAGKSSTYPFLVEMGYIPESLQYICSDNITKNLSNQFSYEDYFFEGERLANELRLEQIKLGQSFVIETNQATNGSYDFVQGVSKRGYDVVMFFICLESDEDCIKRVQTRVSIGGHDVPAEIIKHRYANGLSLLKSHIFQLTNCYLFDNSAQTLRLIASTEGRHILWQTEAMPQWATQVLSTISLFNK